MLSRRKMREACELLNEMIINGMNPDTVTYTSVISGFSKAGDMKEAFNFFREMSQRGLISILCGLCHKASTEPLAFIVPDLVQENNCRYIYTSMPKILSII